MLNAAPMHPIAVIPFGAGFTVGCFTLLEDMQQAAQGQAHFVSNGFCCRMVLCQIVFTEITNRIGLVRQFGKGFNDALDQTFAPHHLIGGFAAPRSGQPRRGHQLDAVDAAIRRDAIRVKWHGYSRLISACSAIMSASVSDSLVSVSTNSRSRSTSSC